MPTRKTKVKQHFQMPWLSQVSCQNLFGRKRMVKHLLLCIFLLYVHIVSSAMSLVIYMFIDLCISSYYTLYCFFFLLFNWLPWQWFPCAKIDHVWWYVKPLFGKSRKTSRTWKIRLKIYRIFSFPYHKSNSGLKMIF